MTRPMMEVRTAPNEKLYSTKNSQLGSCHRRLSRPDSQSAQRREQVVVSLGDVLEEERAIRGHRPANARPQAEERDTQPGEARGKSREKPEDGGEEKSEVEGGGATLRVGVCVESLVDCRMVEKRRRTAAPAPSANLCEARC